VFVKQVWLEQYRNIQTACIQPARHLTVLYGSNGQGKTNFLESVYLLGNARPFRSVKLPDLISHGNRTAAVRGTVFSAGVQSDIVLRLEQHTRRVTVDGKGIQRAADLHGRLAVVIFSPDDTAMVKLGPETRRRYLDRSLYASDAGFLQDYHSYYRILKQRNALLKTNQLEGLDLWTEQLAEAGSRLMDHRQRYADRLNHLLQQKYQQIAGEQEKVALVYQPDLPCTAEDDRAEIVRTVLNNQREQDLRYKTTGRGPHRDDLTFLIGGRSLKGFGSQGQQRSFVLALKMAELDHLQETFGEMPVLLLDDIASELDRERMKNLLSYVRQREVQVLITTTDVTPFRAVLQQDSRLYRMEAGNLTYEGNGVP